MGLSWLVLSMAREVKMAWWIKQLERWPGPDAALGASARNRCADVGRAASWCSCETLPLPSCMGWQCCAHLKVQASKGPAYAAVYHLPSEYC